MDVTSITNNIAIPKGSLNNNIDLSQSEIANPTINNSHITFDYSKVMMDLEEVQDFLFMLIGELSPSKVNKGENINLLA